MLSALLALNAASEQPQNAAYPVESYADISMEGKYAQMAEKYDALQQQVGGLTKELEEMKQELSTTQGENDSTYFRVTMTRRVSVSAGSNVMFDTIDVNVGGWYSIHSGTYLCLVPGLYMFNVHLVNDQDVHFVLKKNSEILARMITRPIGNYYADSTSVPVWCNQGDEVYIVVAGGTASGWIENGMNYFSGALIHT